MGSDRRTELADNLAAVRGRIADAARAAGRAPSELTLVAITKGHPASDVALLAELGVSEVGESRDQEAAPKRADVQGELCWHMVGRLQTNKARSVAHWADVVESVDRLALVHALDAEAQRIERRLAVGVQVSLDGDPDRGGVLERDLPALAEAVVAAGALDLLGLMAVAPLGADPAAAFARLRAIREPFLAAHPEATMLSAGMSADLEAAVSAGATHVRIGTALLGTAFH
ncbi:MAG: dependent protein [Frankiaceae bacterium]|nr:dependent protein [Frankiaceae bacterium]